MGWTRYKGNKGNKYGNVKVERDGVKFDSKLERTMYDMLKKFKIPFEFQVTEELQPPFRDSTGKAIIRITAIVDFEIDFNGKRLYVDTKGEATQVAIVKYKILNYREFMKDANYEIIWLATKKQVNDFVIDLHDKMYNQ